MGNHVSQPLHLRWHLGLLLKFKSIKTTNMKQLITIIALLLISQWSFSQDSSTSKARKVRIETIGGATIEGTVTDSDDTSMTIQSSFGTSTINKSSIASLEYLDNLEDASFLSYNNTYSGSHYLFGPSAFTLEKGEKYYENTYLFVNSFSFGLSDNFSLTAGFEALSPFIGFFPGVYVLPKYSIPFKGGAFAISTPLFFYPVSGEGIGVVQGVLTIGELDKNLTVAGGIGFNFGNSNTTNDMSYIFNVSGTIRTSDRISLVTENLVLMNSVDDRFDVSIFSAGVRIHSKENNNFVTVSLLIPAIPFFSATVILE